MHRNDNLYALARLVRTNQSTALFVIGWFAAAASDEDISRALEAAQEVSKHTLPDGHYEAYRERWGRVPDSPR